MNETSRTRRIAATAAIVAAVLGASPPAGAQGAGERILRYDVDIRILRSGTISVRETIRYDFGSADRHGIFRDIPVTVPYDDDRDRVYPLRVLSVRGSPGTPDEWVEEDVDGYRRIRIGDPDRTVSGRHRYTITYEVDSALNGFADHDELYWNAIGPEWGVPIEEATARVTTPAPISQVACYSGPRRSNLACERARSAGRSATFSQRSMAPFSALTVVVALPKGAVPAPAPILEERWTPVRAFLGEPIAVGVASALALAVVAGFVWIVWGVGRDRRWKGSPVDAVMGSPDGTEQTVPLFESGEAPVEFAPPENLRPGMMGTLIDEVANPLDVTATIVDLAVRKHLVIEEIPKKGWFGKPDWLLTRLEGGDPTVGYERLLLDGLFEDGATVKLSQLRTKFVSRLKRVQQALYAEAVERGWFVRSPDEVRRIWQRAGAGALAAGALLEWLAIGRQTRLAAIPVPLILGGVLLLVGARWMPRRTPKGTATARRANGFRRVIETAETHMARWAEQENVFTRYLPYAVVFGCTEKWAKAFASLGDRPADTSWYISSQGFSYGGFGDAMDGFAVTTAGTIASTPSGSGSSGFGGGGSSGGGGGGGGGGSW